MSDLPLERLDELERIAREATSGPWNLSRSERYVKEGIGAPWVAEMDCGNDRWRANGKYIATFDPPTVLALIAKARSPASVGVGREEMARVIDPHAWDLSPRTGKLYEMGEPRRLRALAKADEIIGLSQTTGGSDG
jgi:hypothetical protein